MFWRGVWGYLPANVVSGVVGFAAIFAFTRLLSPEAMGWYALSVAGANLLHTAVFTWNEAAMARFEVAERDESALRHHRATVYGVLAMGWLVFPVLGLAIAVWPASDGLRAAAAAGVASVMARSILNLAQVRLRAVGAVSRAAGLDMAVTVGSLVLGLGFAWLGLQGAAPLAGLAVASALAAAWAFPHEWRMVRGGGFSRERAVDYARYGVPLSLSLIMTIALGAADRVMLAAFLDGATVGVYHAGYSLASRTLDVMFIWLGMAGAPAVVAAFEASGRAGMEETGREQARLMALITFPAATGLALVARPLCQVMLGPEFQVAAAHVMPWIAASALLAGFTTYHLHVGFTVGRRTGRLLLAMATAAVSNIGLNLVLIPMYGLDGALWATTASFALGAAASWALARGVAALPLPWRDMGLCALACAGMAAVVLLLPALGGLPELVLKAGAGALAYGAFALALDAGGARTQAGRLLHLRRERLA